MSTLESSTLVIIPTYNEIEALPITVERLQVSEDGVVGEIIALPVRS